MTSAVFCYKCFGNESGPTIKFQESYNNLLNWQQSLAIKNVTNKSPFLLNKKN